MTMTLPAPHGLATVRKPGKRELCYTGGTSLILKQPSYKNSSPRVDPWTLEGLRLLGRLFF